MSNKGEALHENIQNRTDVPLVAKRNGKPFGNSRVGTNATNDKGLSRYWDELITNHRKRSNLSRS